MPDFKETQHPRDDGGKFASVNSSGMRKITEQKEFKPVKLEEARIFALNGSPVSILSGKEFQKDGVRLTDKVTRYYKEKYNGEVDSVIGKIKLDEEGVKNDIAHGIGAKKAAAFMAVPEVINKGKLFDWQVNWKNRGYDTGVFIAPIEIDGERYIEEVVVEKRTKGQRLYVHEVEIERKLEDFIKTPTKEGHLPTSRLIIAEKIANGNKTHSQENIPQPQKEVKDEILKELLKLARDKERQAIQSPILDSETIRDSIKAVDDIFSKLAVREA
ncbi:MAG: hypothetical protein LBV16_06300 [Elusimicrobiota bacterium]|nr:hypothetical protein [Elusimicrobiota bacterium]